MQYGNTDETQTSDHGMGVWISKLDPVYVKITFFL